MGDCNCVNNDTFPTEQPTISITNWVELIRIESSCDSNRNQFEMIPYTNRTIRSTMCKYNVNENTHTCYKVAEIKQDRFKLNHTNYLDNITRKSIYFFVNNNIQQQISVLETKLFDAYKSKYGTVRTGSVYFPEPIIRFPFQMPSRFTTFR